MANGKPKSHITGEAIQPGRAIDRLDNGADPDLNSSKTIEEKLAEWGGITAREREAVQEAAGEKVLDKYQKLVKDYYQSLSKQAVQH